MKKTIINFCGIKIVVRVFLLLFFTILTSSSIAQITYGIYNNSTRTFTIGYGATLPTNAVEINCERGECIIPYYNVEKIIIEKSFAEYKPTTCRNWFYNCWNLKSIEGLVNVNTQEVKYMSSMFQYCSNLESLDLSNFETDNVVSMDTMFCNCDKLASLDLSSFKTDNVTNMSGMFLNCSHLKAVFVSDKWSTKSVTKFNYIFGGCKVLYGEKGTHCESNDIKYACIDEGETKPGYFTRIGNEIYIPIVPYGVYDSNNKTLTIGYGEIPENADEINTKIDYYDGWIGSGVRSCYNNSVEKIIIEKSFADCKISTCRCWFYGCNRLVEIEGLGNVNTQEVTDMSSMFSSCYSLTSLDLSKFNTSAVTDMSGMFSYCNHLICVFVSDKWTTKSVKKSDNIFYNCWRLYGEKETNNEGDDIKFARIDGGKENPGYFTRSGNTPYYPELFPYGIYDSKTRTLTIGYGKIPENAVEINTKFYGGWIGNEVPSCYNNNVEKIVFEKSFADYKSTTCRNWFYGCEYLKSIEGIENINTVAVTDMSWMFYECRNLTSLDLSNFNTAAVTDMSRMFDFCRNLSILDFSSFNTEKTINMSCMFHYCSSITNLDLKNFNTVNVTNMTGMFMGCSKLTSLDISNFKTDNVVLIDSMFYGLSVNALDLSSFKTDKVTSMREMFLDVII
ncbi:MAG: BspA family leucine-rich repeat surface protein [Bacteroidales bacterium]|nr:BspA family leucine-rich repeat surface protein [Bacteroidales bacterium]